MKRFLRHLVASFLAVFARAVIRKYRPMIVMITGSVGKTSTKDAVSAALSRHFYIRASEKSYNSEFGVPLTILGAKNPWTNPLAWIRVFTGAFGLIWLPSAYPKVLVLEVGADRPGDLARILRIASPDAVVVTRLPDMPVHVEAYASPDAVREEEFQPAYALPPGAPLVLSNDDPHATKLAAPLTAHASTFGWGEADVSLGSPELRIEKGEVMGMEASVTVEGKEHTLLIRGAIGSAQFLAPAAALALAQALEVPVSVALKGLESYVPPPGRGRLIRGKENSLIIDDTYNASPAAVEEGLHALSFIKERIPGTRRVAVLGDMLELGRYSQEAHENIGRIAREHADYLVTIGPRAYAIAHAAIEAGMLESAVRSFATSKEAAPEVAVLVASGDAVLVKGSQSVRTERVVESLLAEEGDRKLLVRQEREWKRR